MWNYEKRLEYPINIKRTDAAMAKAIISQFGGPDGETGAAMRYLSQRFSMPYRPVMGVLTDVGIEASNRNLPQPKHSPRRLSSGASFCLRQIPIYISIFFLCSLRFASSLSSTYNTAVTGIANIIPIAPKRLPPINAALNVQSGASPTEPPTTLG